MPLPSPCALHAPTGKTITIHGRKMRMVDTDPFTRSWYLYNMGLDLGAPVDVEMEYKIGPAFAMYKSVCNVTCVSCLLCFACRKMGDPWSPRLSRRKKFVADLPVQYGMGRGASSRGEGVRWQNLAGSKGHQ